MCAYSIKFWPSISLFTQVVKALYSPTKSRSHHARSCCQEACISTIYLLRSIMLSTAPGLILLNPTYPVHWCYDMVQHTHRLSSQVYHKRMGSCLHSDIRPLRRYCCLTKQPSEELSHQWFDSHADIQTFGPLILFQVFPSSRTAQSYAKHFCQKSPLS